MSARVYDINARLAQRQIEDLAKEIEEKFLEKMRSDPPPLPRIAVRRSAEWVLKEFLRREQDRGRGEE